MRVVRGIAALCAAALIVTGCGSSKKSEEQQVKDTLTSYYKAAAGGDGAKICDLLETQTRAQLERRAGGKKCGDVVAAALAQPAYKKLAPAVASAKVTKVTVNGTAATATVQATGRRPFSVPLTKEGGTWKVQSALGG